MSPKDQRIEIAKPCGWKLMPRLFHNGEWKDVPTWVEKRFYEGQPEDYCAAGQYLGDMPPDYLNDLNAMHEAEKVLNFSQRRRYYEALRTVWQNPSGYRVSDIELVRSTACERAEAFLKTLGLWK